MPIADAQRRIDEANERMGSQGLRVLAFATRMIDEADVAAATADPMSFARELSFAGMVGIIDPLRSEAKHAVDVALRAGIDVRMITGDHAVTAQAIGETLGLGPGAISGAELRELTDEQLAARLPELHVFGRVAPEDKLRLAQVMQGQGSIVAMTGDAVNDAAALKQADIGVAMGSGSEVSKQAARMILTDDNFGTLVHAVELGRTIYGKVVSYVRYQMAQLLALVMLFLAATAFNINSGVALTPLMVLFLNFFIAIFPVIVIMLDPGDPGVMDRPPRDPRIPITNRAAVTRWVLYGAVLFLAGLVPLVAGPDDPQIDQPSASMTMTFVVIGLGTVFSGLVMRRDPTSGLTPPLLGAVKVLVVPARARGAGHRARFPAAGTGDAVAHRSAVAGVPRAGARPSDRRGGGQVAAPPARPSGSPARHTVDGQSGPGCRCDDSLRPSTTKSDRTNRRPAMVATDNERDEAPGGTGARMKSKEYQQELRPLQGELVAMQEWVKTSGAKVCVVFEGRDTAGKGGTIKALTERVSPRVFRVVALPSPTDRERSQMYIQRYIPHLPASGEVVIFDRSWYNRAGVERVMGFCGEDDVKRFLQMVPGVEQAIVDSGVHLIKYWLEVSPEEQTRRLQRRIDDPRRVWKLSDMDLKSYSRWYDYSRAIDEMFVATDTEWAPWHVAYTDDKKRAKLNVIAHLLSQIPYDPLKPKDVTLPERQAPNGYVPSAHIPRPVPTAY